MLEGWVRLHVSAQVWSVGKRFATVRTPERLLTRMRAHVALQQPGPAECFAAHVALVLEVVGQEVHGHRGHWNVDFATRGALLGHLAVYAPVCLLVPAQVGGRGVGFAALTAGVPLSGSRVCCRSPSWPSVHYEKGIHCVPLAHGCVPIDVSTGRWRHLRTRAVRLVRIAVDIAMDTRIGVVDAAIDEWRMARGGNFRDDRWVTSHDIIVRRWTQVITDVAWREREREEEVNYLTMRGGGGDWLEIRNWLVLKIFTGKLTECYKSDTETRHGKCWTGFILSFLWCLIINKPKAALEVLFFVVSLFQYPIEPTKSWKITIFNSICTGKYLMLCYLCISSSNPLNILNFVGLFWRFWSIRCCTPFRSQRLLGRQTGWGSTE